MVGQSREGMALMREARGGLHFLPRRLCSLGEAQAASGNSEAALDTLAEALAVVEKTGERHWESEILRVRGELLVALGNQTEAEDSLRRAIEVARRQSARSWELRATTSLARLWQQQGRTREAHKMLAKVYGWFTEGFDTQDLSEARALLDGLSLPLEG
jgi:predicted ATPase